MKKCERLIEYLDENEFNDGSKKWLDIQEHSRKCPDCLIDFDLRKQMNNELSHMSSVQIPASLHSEIMQSIEIGKDAAEPGKIEQFFNNLLVPMQYGFATVCLYLVFSLSSLPATNKKINPVYHKYGFSKAGKIAKLNSIKHEKPQQLAEVSPDEVKDFLKKFNKYKREHPEINNNYHSSFSNPRIKLVSDWK